MNLDELISSYRTKKAALLEERAVITDNLSALAAQERHLDQKVDEAEVIELRTRKTKIDARITELDAKIRVLGAEKAEDERVSKAQSSITETDAGKRARGAISDAEYRVGQTGAAEANSSRTLKAGSFIRVNDGRLAAVERGASVRSHPVVAERIGSERDQHVIGQHGSLGQMVRAMTTTSGSAIVPTLWSADVIDRARNFSAVLKAGAQIVPMDAKVLQIGRLTGDPTAAFRTEGSTISASDVTLDNVTLTATTMSCLLVGSMEWFQDADNADEVVMNAISQSFATQLDLVALYGSITSGSGTISLASPPNPRGVLGALLAVASSSVLGAATNGTAQTATTYWNEVLDTIFTVKDFNEAPNALIGNSKLARQYAKAYDTTGQPLLTPPQIEGLPWYVSNQIQSFTQGTMTSRATDLFVGDWSQLLIGQRMDFTIQTLTERYAENGQIGIVATWRGDVQPARPRAFAVYRALQGA